VLVALDQDPRDLGLDHDEPDLAALELLLRQPDLHASIPRVLIDALQSLERPLHVAEILVLPGIG
jgi:hypothetical protein